MLENSSEEQFCYTGSNVSCIRAQYSVGTQVGLYLVFGCVILMNIVGNFVVILSIGHFKQLHSPTNLVVMSLAVVDLLVGLTVLPFSMTRTVQGCWFYGDSFCQLHSCTDFFLTAASILHIVCIAVDRYEAVCNPLRYMDNITMSVAWFMVLACWVVAAVYCYGLLYSKNNIVGMEDFLESIYCIGSCNLLLNSLWGTVDTAFFFFLPVTVIIGLYSRIFHVAKKHMRKIEDSNQCAHSKGEVSKRSEHKAAKTLGIVVGAFVLCWMPYCLTTFIDPYVGFSTPAPLFEAFNWLTYLNSTMNPIIYALFYPWFRKCVQLIITRKIFHSNSSDTNVFLK